MEVREEVEAPVEVPEPGPEHADGQPPAAAGAEATSGVVRRWESMARMLPSIPVSPGTAKRFPLAGLTPLEAPWGHLAPPLLGEGMNVGLYRTVAAMSANQQRVEIISSNIANADATGFKRMLHVAHGVADWGVDRAHTQVAAATQLDMSQGVLQTTGNSLDVALNGEGFFVLDGPNGEALTRNGSFQLTDRGVLVSHDGRAVQW